MNTTNDPASAATATPAHPRPSPAGTGPTATERLAEPFPVEHLGWLPKVVKGNRALAIPFIDARMVQDRLDQVMGPENWQDEYDVMPGGSVICRLKLRVNGEWVPKVDVGSPSEQPDAGDKLKAAFSDALKRAAVKWGIGRYLYDIAPVWCDYDGAAKKFTQTPQLPAWARPKAITHNGHTGQALPERAAPQQQHPADNTPAEQKKPATGEELFRRLWDYDIKLEANGSCQAGELISYISESGAKAGYGKEIKKWSGPAIQFAIESAKQFAASLKQQQAQQPPQQPQGRPNAASLTVREGVLNTLRERMGDMSRAYKEEPDTFLKRRHKGLTMAWLEARHDLFGVDAIAQLADEVEQYVRSGVPD